MKIKARRIKVRLYDLLSDAVESGVGWGVHYAFKHSGPDLTEDERERLKEQIRQSVMSELCEKIDFD